MSAVAREITYALSLILMPHTVVLECYFPHHLQIFYPLLKMITLVNYDAAVLSNVITSQKLIENKQKIAELLSALLGVLKPGAVVIIRENLDQYSAQLISEVTKFLDVFATSKDDKVLGFNFYGMNQVQDSMFAHNNFLDVLDTEQSEL
uniref:Phosphoethanolamine N-methyltransferase 2 N-terminal domain-containing protein n=1 Tax=Ditylenchus dipsaci TaxID=166011 RepID=A0A915D0H6_9BILA